MNQLQPSPLHSQAEHRPTVASKIAATLFAIVILIFAVISTHLVWANPDMEIWVNLENVAFAEKLAASKTTP